MVHQRQGGAALEEQVVHSHKTGLVLDFESGNWLGNKSDCNSGRLQQKENRYHLARLPNETRPSRRGSIGYRCPDGPRSSRLCSLRPSLHHLMEAKGPARSTGLQPSLIKRPQSRRRLMNSESSRRNHLKCLFCSWPARSDPGSFRTDL